MPLSYNDPMHHFFIEGTAISPPIVQLTKEQAHHISSVLRLRPGDFITVADNHGNIYRSRLVEPAAAEIVATESVEPFSQRLVLFQALVKAGKMETVVQKCTELGVDEVRPFIASRSVARPGGAKAERKNSRLGKIALAAAEQSGRAFLPVIGDTLTWPALLGAMADFPLVLLAWEDEKSMMMRSALGASEPDRIAIVVGPEGGFGLAEVDELVALGARPVSLGPFTMRTETAAIAAVAIARHCTQSRRRRVFE